MKPTHLDPLLRRFLGTPSSCAILPRPFHPLTPASRTSVPRAPPRSLLAPEQRRGKATTARTKRALNIAPHFSFVTQDDPDRDVIIFNPPSAEPSVQNTPFKFLPKSDLRRVYNIERLLARPETDATKEASQATPSSSSSSTGVGGGSEDELPPLLPSTFKNSWASPAGPRYHITLEQAMEIKRLRRADPRTWSVQALAEKFDCSPRFVIMCAGTMPRAYHQQLDRELESVKRKWGPRRANAREDRAKRRDLLFSGRL